MVKKVERGYISFQNRKPLNFNSNIGRELIAKIRQHLEENGACTVSQLVPVINRTSDRTRNIVFDMWNGRLLHVWDWGADKDGRFVIPIYAWGDEPDAERPPRRPPYIPTGRPTGRPRKQPQLQEHA
jgi:hypothetical protein